MCNSWFQLAIECADASIIVVAASNLVKTVRNWHRVGKAMEAFEVEESSAESVFCRFPNVRLVSALVTMLDSANKVSLVREEEHF